MNTGRLQFRGTVATRGEASAHLKEPGDAVLIERGRPRLFLLSCPCGCMEEFPINLDPRAGPAWRLYRSGHSNLSIFPSVWRTSGCRSHFIIWRGKILLFGSEDEFEPTVQEDEIARLNSLVLERLPNVGVIPFSDVADAINAVPWDVLTVCRQLVRKGLAREGIGKQRGAFGRA